MKAQPSAAALILAAGESSRMGQDKALLQYQGHPFLEVIIGNLRQVGIDRILVVLGHHAAEIQQSSVLAHAEVVVNENYRLGQTSSLQAGLRALDLPATDGVLLCLVDHPAVQPEVIGRLLLARKESGAPVVVPVYRGRRGHPVFIARALFKELLALETSEGANSVIRNYRDSTYWLDVDQEGVLQDVDRPEDYQRLVATSSHYPEAR
jgi:molybdenum cofactor cytidylyltransferase